MRYFSIFFNRVNAETPTWFKRIAQLAGVVALICAALIAGVKADEFHLSAQIFNWVKIIGAVSTAVAMVSVTAKEDKK